MWHSFIVIAVFICGYRISHSGQQITMSYQIERKSEYETEAEKYNVRRDKTENSWTCSRLFLFILFWISAPDTHLGWLVWVGVECKVYTWPGDTTPRQYDPKHDVVSTRPCVTSMYLTFESAKVTLHQCCLKIHLLYYFMAKKIRRAAHCN